MLLTLNKIREIAFDLDNCQAGSEIKDYRIHLNGDLGINVYISTAKKGLIDYSKYGSNGLIKIEELEQEEIDEGDYYKFIFEDKQKINLGYRERLRTLFEPDIESVFNDNKEFPPIISFYSYKGGLGRSAALAGFAIHCAYHLDKKVLVIDCDLEAPGIPGFYDIDADILHKTNGLVEYFLNKKFDAKKTDLSDYLIQLDKKYSGTKGDIFVMPAGNLSDDIENEHYKTDDLKFKETDRLNRYGTHRAHYLEGLARLAISNAKSIMQDFALLIKELKADPNYSPDVILIDSRTGFTEILGIFVLYLSDIVVGFFRDELQTKPGLHFLFEKIAENKKDQKLVMVNAINSDSAKIKKFEEKVKLLAESFDAGEGPYNYHFASIHENSVLKNLGGDSEEADLSYLELITQKQFHSYNRLFELLEDCIQRIIERFAEGKGENDAKRI